MANSPDMRKYVDLTVYDEDPIVLLNEILGTARGLMPGWRPEAGQIETVLAEAFAVRTSEVSNSINRVPDAATEILLQLYGLYRSDGTKSKATILINFYDSDSIERSLPAGTEFMYIDGVTGVAYAFELNSSFTLSGSKSGYAEVTAVSVGTANNISAKGRSLTLISNAVFFESAKFETAASGGTNPETDDEYFDRGIQLLASYTSGSTTPEQIKYYVGANFTFADRVEVYNRRRYRDRDITAPDYGTHDGAVLVAVGSEVGTNASAAAEVTVAPSNLSQLHSDLQERSPAGLIIDVMSAELVKIHVDASFVLKDGFIGSEVKTAVEESLKGYLDSNSWDWSDNVVRRYEVVALIDIVEGVDYITYLSIGGETLVGADNVGYYTQSGGRKTTVDLDIIGVTPGDAAYAPNTLTFYHVSTEDNGPVVHEYQNTATVTLAGGAQTGVQFEAVSNGVEHNDTNNGGDVDPDAVFPGSSANVLDKGSATVSSGSELTGGSSDFEQFTVLDSDVTVEEDVVLRNLGTLVTYGNINITVEASSHDNVRLSL